MPASVPFHVQDAICEHDQYHPEREVLAESLLGVSPAWFGTPINGLNELGQYIASDPRFSACTVETFASLLWKRDIESADSHTLEELRNEKGFQNQARKLHA